MTPQLPGTDGIQGKTEVLMETQPPMDLSALMRVLKEQADQIAALQQLLVTELADIKQSQRDSDLRITHLTQQLSGGYSGGYSGGEEIRRQEQTGDPMQIVEQHNRYCGRDKDNPPLVAEGAQLTCVRCGYQWTPRTRRPKKCPECETPWWFPPRWRWHQSQTQSQ